MSKLVGLGLIWGDFEDLHVPFRTISIATERFSPLTPTPLMAQKKQPARSLELEEALVWKV